MKIQVSRVPEEGLREDADYEPAELDMEREDIRLPKPFHVSAMAQLAERELVVHAEIRCPVRMTCAKCLDEFEATLAPRGLFTYTVTPTDVVDITDDVREEIILAYPMIPVCREECKGLCRQCGQNLNAASCSHQEVRN